jgi:pilus assembly protein CpaE
VQRRALIADDAAGPIDAADAVLTRFGFSGTVRATDRDQALALMARDDFDLVILSVANIDPGQLLALERELRRNPGTSVIATAPSPDSDLILRAMRVGVHEFLVHPPPPEELAASVERLMRRSAAAGVQHGDLIAVYTAKGGLGSTSIAVNLAQAFGSMRPDARVALADLVVSGGDVRVFLNLQSDYDLGDLVAKGTKVDGELLNSLLTACPGGVWALPTGENPENDDLFDASAIGSILELLTANFAITVADCEHHLSERTLTVLDAASRIVLVTELSLASLRSTQRTVGVCRRLGYDENKLCVVVNRYQSADVLPLKDAEDVLKWPIFWKLPNDYRLSAAALTKGVPIVLGEPTSRLAKSYRELAVKLGGLMQASPDAQNGTTGSRVRKFFGMRSGDSDVT